MSLVIENRITYVVHAVRSWPTAGNGETVCGLQFAWTKGDVIWAKVARRKVSCRFCRRRL